MKPISILVTIAVSAALLSLVVLIASPTKNVPVAANTETATDALPIPTKGPFGKADVTTKEFSFGVNIFNSKDEHTFTLKNVGQGTLEVKMGKPSNRCIFGEITKETGEIIQSGTLVPGESVKIPVKWEIKADMHMFRHLVPVYTTDPDHQRIDFTITGIVENLTTIRPEGDWNIGDLNETKPSHAEGYIISSIVDHFTVTEEPRENSRVKVTIEPADLTSLALDHVKCGYKISVDVAPGVPVGLFRETITLKSQSSIGECSTEFTVGGLRTGPIDVRGVLEGAAFNAKTNKLTFSDFPASAGKKAQLTLFVRGLDDQLVLNAVEPADTKIKFTLIESESLGQTRSYRLEVEIPPGPAVRHRGDEAQLVVLKLNHPEVPDFRMLIDYNSLR